MRKLFLISAFIILTATLLSASKKTKENKTKFPDEYEVYQSENWELQLFYWNRHGQNRIMHGMLYFRGNQIPNGTSDNVIETELGSMRYIVRENRFSGNSGWIPDGGMFLDAYKSEKKLYLNDLKKINIQNNPKLESEDEQHQRLLDQEKEWNSGKSNHEQDERNRYDSME